MEWILLLSAAVLTVGSIFGLAWLNRSGRSRIREFQKLELPADALDVLADAILTDFGASCPGPDKPIRIPADYWRNIDWPNDRVLKLLEYVMHRGWAAFPDFDWNAGVSYGLLPNVVELTETSCKKYTPTQPSSPSVVVYGNAHLGAGDQIINGDVIHDWRLVEPLLRDLLRDVHMEAAIQQPYVAAQLEGIAEALALALDQREVRTRSVRGALHWLAGFASDASSSAAGAGIAAAASALLGMIMS